MQPSQVRKENLRRKTLNPWSSLTQKRVEPPIKNLSTKESQFNCEINSSSPVLCYTLLYAGPSLILPVLVQKAMFPRLMIQS